MDFRPQVWVPRDTHLGMFNSKNHGLVDLPMRISSKWNELDRCSGKLDPCLCLVEFLETCHYQKRLCI